MDKSHREPSTGKEPKIWTLENLKSTKSRNRKNKKEPRAVENRRDCRIQMRSSTRRSHLLQCGMTNTCDNNCGRDDLFNKPTDEVIKLIQYWLKKGI